MFRASFRLGKLFGVEIGINSSLLLVAILVIYQMAEHFFPMRLPDLALGAYWIAGSLTALLFFASVLWHEMAHALMARFFALPVRHIILNLIGGVALLEDEPRTPTQAFWVAFVGPLSSAILGGGFIGLGWLLTPERLSGAMFTWLGQINFILAAFNMMPGFPLDGGRVFHAILWFITRNHLLATLVAVRTGQGLALLFFAASAMSFILSGDMYTGMWLGLIGWFLWAAGTGYLRYARRKKALHDIPVRQVLGRNVRLSPDWSLSYAWDVMTVDGPTRVAPVIQDEQTVGIFSVESLLRVPNLNWGILRVGQVMKPLTGLVSISPETDIFDALRQMEQADADYALVKNELGTLGILGRYDLLRYAEARTRLQSVGRA